MIKEDTVLEKLFSDFVDGLHEGVVTLDHLRIAHCNDAFRRMFDITPELDVTTLQVNHLVNEASSVALVSALREQVTSGLHQSLELVGIRKRGTLFPVQITLKLLGTKQLIIWRDMTLDKQVESLQAIQAAAQYVPEQILTSVRTIEELAEILLRGELQPLQQQYCQMIKVPAAFLANLAQDFVSYHKLLGNMVLVEEIEFDLYRTVEEINTRFGNMVTPYIGVDVPRVLVGDPTCLKQVIVNIINHVVGPAVSGVAESETPHGHNEIQLVIESDPIRTTETHTQLRFSLSGTGKEDWLYANLNSFAMGFKLPIAKKLVELMKGRLGVEHVSDGPGLSQFWFTAMFSRSTNDWDLPKKEDLFKGLNTRILLIEKNPSISKIIQSYLQSLHCQCTAAVSYAEAWGILKNPSQKPHDIILISEEVSLETASPGFILNLKGSSLWHIPLVLITKSPMVDDKHLREVGFADYVPRPISLTTIRSTLEKLYGFGPAAPSSSADPALRSKLRGVDGAAWSGNTADKNINSSSSLLPRESKVLRTSSAATATTPAGNNSSAAILLVDDNVVNQKILANIIKQMGLDYDVVSDGRQAVEAYSSQPRRYGVILMDTIMPVMDGFVATREIRRREQGTGRHIPIVAVTGIALDPRYLGENAVENAEELCLKCGMDEYIPKPVIMKNLKNTILKWLNKGGVRKNRVPMRSLREQCMSVVSEHLERYESLHGLADELVQRIADIAPERQFTTRTAALFSTARLTRLAIHRPFPAFKIDLMLQQLQSQTDLQELDLRGCSYLTDRGVSFIAQRCSQLQSLNLSRCPRVTDWGLSDLRNLTKLRSINIEGCPLISEVGIKAIKEIPSLQDVFSFDAE